VTLYLDSSVLLAGYLGEDLADRSAEIVASDPVLCTSWLTTVEVRRTLARAHGGTIPSAVSSRVADDTDALALIGADPAMWADASVVAEVTGARSLDAVHLAAARSIGVPSLVFATFDLRQAQAARSLGMAVVGA
jgi:predicted nucleic acid-binding protein